jgi:DNA-binding transcriptional LysR family regulator
MELGSVEVVKRMVELGFGVSVVPRVCVDEELRRESLVAIPVLPKAERRSIGLLTPARRPLPRAAGAFADLSRSLLRGD